MNSNKFPAENQATSTREALSLACALRQKPFLAGWVAITIVFIASLSAALCIMPAASQAAASGVAAGAQAEDRLAFDQGGASVAVQKIGRLDYVYMNEAFYNITITNNGDLDLTVKSIVDSRSGDLTEEAFYTGCDFLRAGEHCRLYYEDTVDIYTDPDPLVNIIRVEYTAVLADGTNVTVSDEDSFELNLFQPSIEVTKDGPDLARPGEVISYTITITNTGSEDAGEVYFRHMRDDMLELEPPENCWELELGESCTFTYEYHIPTDIQTDSFTNAIYVEYQLLRIVVSDEDEHTTYLFWPAITLEKSGEAAGQPGDEVGYTLTLANTSSSHTPPMTCTISDPMLGLEQAATLQTGDEVAIQARYTIRPADPDPLVNTARAECTVAGFAEVYATEASHTLDIHDAPPVCGYAYPSQALLWPPNHQFVPVQVLGVSEPNGGDLSIRIDGIYQDEPVVGKGDGNTAPDGKGTGTPVAHLRAERAGNGNGRVYTVSFTALNNSGGSCTGSVLVGAPKDRATPPVDDGPLYDSTFPNGSGGKKKPF